MPTITILWITCTDNKQSCNNMKLSDFKLYLYHVYIPHEHSYVKTMYDFKYKTHNAQGLQWRNVASVNKWQYHLTLIYIWLGKFKRSIYLYNCIHMLVLWISFHASWCFFSLTCRSHPYMQYIERSGFSTYYYICIFPLIKT